MYQEERVVRAVRLPVSTDAELRALADARRCSINELVAGALQDLVDEAPTVGDAAAAASGTSEQPAEHEVSR